jgi:hypothetical protein
MRVRTSRRLAPALLLLAGACAGAPAGTSPAPRVPDADAAFDTLVARLLRNEGRPRVPDALAWLTPHGVAAERAWVGAQLARLRAADTTALGEAQRIDFLLVESHLARRERDLAAERYRRTPMSYLPFDGVYAPLAGADEPTAAGWETVLARLRHFRRAVELGRTQLVSTPPLWADMTRATGARMVSFLEAELPRRVEGGRLAPETRAALLFAADSAASSLRALLDFVQHELPREDEQAWAVGTAEYDWLLRSHHMLPYDAAALIELGEALHERTRRQLDSLAAAVAPGVGWRALADSLKRNHPHADGVRAAYERESNRAKAHLIRHDLFRIPPCERLLFIDTPPQLRATYAYGGYSPASPGDSVHTGRFFVTPVEAHMTPAEVEAKLRGHNHGWITVVALHEGYPGHHLQTVKKFENPRVARRRLSDSYFGEGWALYAEDFMRRTGFYETTDALVAQLRMRLWRTARVIIDPSIHTGRMSYEDAVRLLVEDVGLERADAEAEVNRYTTWPAQAPSYVIGWIEIERLREELERAGGAAFDERAFHDRLLTVGSMPLALVRRAFGLDP